MGIRMGMKMGMKMETGLGLGLGLGEKRERGKVSTISHRPTRWDGDGMVRMGCMVVMWEADKNSGWRIGVLAYQ